MSLTFDNKSNLETAIKSTDQAKLKQGWIPNKEVKSKLVNLIKSVFNKRGELLDKYSFYSSSLKSIPNPNTIPKDCEDFLDELDDDSIFLFKSKEYKQYERDLKSIQIQTENIQNGLCVNGDIFDGSYRACNNFYSDIRPEVRKHLYDII